MGMFMADVVALAKKRRAMLLKEFEKSGFSMRRFAISKGFSPARMWQLIDKAKREVSE